MAKVFITFIKRSVLPTEQTLLQHACQTVSSLPTIKFKSNHQSKAEVASWMAWQESPGQGLNGAVGGRLLDFKNGLAKQYVNWLQKVFS